MLAVGEPKPTTPLVIPRRGESNETIRAERDAYRSFVEDLLRFGSGYRDDAEITKRREVMAYLAERGRPVPGSLEEEQAKAKEMWASREEKRNG